jgi:hypothetical protein
MECCLKVRRGTVLGIYQTEHYLRDGEKFMAAAYLRGGNPILEPAG